VNRSRAERLGLSDAGKKKGRGPLRYNKRVRQPLKRERAFLLKAEDRSRPAPKIERRKEKRGKSEGLDLRQGGGIIKEGNWFPSKVHRLKEKKEIEWEERTS